MKPTPEQVNAYKEMAKDATTMKQCCHAYLLANCEKFIEDKLDKCMKYLESVAQEILDNDSGEVPDEVCYRICLDYFDDEIWKKEEEEEARIKKEQTMATEMRNNSPAFDVLAVTDVKVFPFKDSPTLGHMKAIATVVINDQLLIRGLRVMEGENGMFVGYPLDPFYKGENFRSLCMPMTRAFREHVENCVLEKFQYAITGGFDDAGANG